MTRSLLAGLTYVAIVFAAGFALGLLRVLWLMPTIGDLAGVALELPLILLFSWFVCGWVIERFRVPPSLRQRALMGAVALVILVLAELGVSIFMTRSVVGDLVHTYLSPAGALALAGQLVFALFPILRLARARAPLQTA